MEEEILEEEEWRPIRYLEGKYEVSSLGRVKSLPKQCNNWRPMIRKQRRNSSGYPSVHLRYDGKMVGKLVHHLVADAFLDPRPVGKEINHKDGNKDNNRPGNLEYVTRGENCRHCVAIGHHQPHRGEASGRARLTDEKVRWIRANKDRFSSCALARQLGVSSASVWQVVNNKTWKHVE